MTNSYSVLNTVAATAGDISVAGRKLNVAITASTGTPSFPTMDYRYIESINFQPAVLEQLQISWITFTPAANTTYQFEVTQATPIVSTTTTVPATLPTFNPSSPVSVISVYTSDAAGTDAAIQAGLAANINANSAVLGVVATTSAGKIILTAVTGTPTFNVAAGTNTTLAAAALSNVLSTTVASNTTATPSVVTASAAHGLLTGNVVVFVSADETKLASGTYRVLYLSATTVSFQTLAGVAVAGTSTTTGTWSKRPQASVGVGATIAANGIAGAATGYLYSLWTFNYGILANAAMVDFTVNAPNLHTLYVQEGLATTTGDPTTNYTNFKARMVEVGLGYGAGVTTSDPKLIAANA
jgi:hypothetical protein